MAGLLDFLGFGDGLTLPDQAGAEAGIGVLDRPTLMRMMKMANPTGQQFNTRPGLPGIGMNRPQGPGLAEQLGIGAIPGTAPPGQPQTDNLPPYQGRGLPAGATPFPTAPPPSPVVPGAPAGLLAEGLVPNTGAQAGATPVQTTTQKIAGLDDPNNPQAPQAPQAPQKPLTPGQQTAIRTAPATNGLLDRVMGFLNKNSDTLLGISAGFGGAPSFGAGLGRAATGAMYGNKQDYAREGQNLTANILQSRGGYSPEEAAAISRDPEQLKMVLNRLFPQPEFKTITDSRGNQRLVRTNAATGTVENPNVVPSGAPQVQRIEQAFSLPRGTVFVDPTGSLRRVP